MAAQAILDTDILSEYLKGHDPNVVRRGDRYAEEHGVFTFTSVTVFEILAGLEHKDARSQLSKNAGLAGSDRRDHAACSRLS